ncbi:MAG: hypothetical protein QUV05_21675 [Phycisphaerae bacterium]|nr:hypothetical protein [Phycisphaerae bacterium]
MEMVTQVIESKKRFRLTRRDGTTIPCRIPESYSVGEAAKVLAERAGYEPQQAAAREGMGFRLGVQEDAGLRLLPDDTRFGDLPEEAQFRVIPSLAPAAVLPRA